MLSALGISGLCTHRKSFSRQGLRGHALLHHAPLKNLPPIQCLACDGRQHASPLAQARSSYHPRLTLASLPLHPQFTVRGQNVIALGHIWNIAVTAEMRLECPCNCYCNNKFSDQGCCACVVLKIWPGTEMCNRWHAHSTASATYSSLVYRTSQIHGSICYITILTL